MGSVVRARAGLAKLGKKRNARYRNAEIQPTTCADVSHTSSVRPFLALFFPAAYAIKPTTTMRTNPPAYEMTSLVRWSAGESGSSDGPEAENAERSGVCSIGGTGTKGGAAGRGDAVLCGGRDGDVALVQLGVEAAFPAVVKHLEEEDAVADGVVEGDEDDGRDQALPDRSEQVGDVAREPLPGAYGQPDPARGRFSPCRSTHNEEEEERETLARLLPIAQDYLVQRAVRSGQDGECQNEWERRERNVRDRCTRGSKQRESSNRTRAPTAGVRLRCRR